MNVGQHLYIQDLKIYYSGLTENLTYTTA